MESVIFPQDFVRAWKSGLATTALVVDVREAWELEQFRLPHTAHIPMQQIPAQIAQIDDALAAQKAVYIVCAHGVRSAVVTDYLVQHGRAPVYNVAGGMEVIAALLAEGAEEDDE